MDRRRQKCHASLPLLLLLLLSSFASAAPVIPDTPAGRAFGDWLTSFNSADATQIAAFKLKYARKGEVAETLQFRDATGGFELLDIESRTPNQLLALLKSVATESGNHLEVTIRGDGRGSDNFIMDLRPAKLPLQFAPPRLSMDAALKALSERARQKAAADQLSGALLLAKHEQTLFQKAYGYASRKQQRRATLQTQFRLGSINKVFTAIAVLQLVESGKLSLHGTVGRYLPNYPNREIAEKVTVHHLLAHTGGTGDIFGPEFDQHRLQLKEHADYVAMFGNRAPEYPPGSQDGYSNYGYVLLGNLIESVSGMSYYDYVQTNVYAKAGMQSTGSLPESLDVPMRADGYMKEASGWTSNATTLPYRGMAAGGGYSTVGDLLRFAQALQSGKLLSKHLLRTATSAQNIGGGFGYGFALEGEGAEHFYGAVGGAPGMNGALRIYPHSGYVLVSLSNLDPPTAETVLEFFSARMPLDAH